MFYKNLDRFTKSFVGGTVLAKAGGVVDCVTDAAVALAWESQVVAQTRTDDFGDFKIDGLAPEDRNYEIRITKGGYQPARVAVSVRESRYVGEIMLSPE